MRLIAATIAALLVTTPAWAGGEDAEAPSGPIEFQMPSGNVGCVFIPEGGTSTYSSPDGGAELQCDRIAPTYMRVILGASGKAKRYTAVGDASCCSGEVLPYGELWTAGPFSCIAAKTGLTCTRGKHGFVMSRSAVKAY